MSIGQRVVQVVSQIKKYLVERKDGSRVKTTSAPFVRALRDQPHSALLRMANGSTIKLLPFEEAEEGNDSI